MIFALIFKELYITYILKLWKNGIEDIVFCDNSMHKFLVYRDKTGEFYQVPLFIVITILDYRWRGIKK